MIDGNDTCKDGLLGCLFVDVKCERIVFSQKLYDLFARDVVHPKFKRVPRIVVSRISKGNFFIHLNLGWPVKHDTTFQILQKG